ncbi:MAG: SH3 domain-containing protein [Anaerolineae bacterium]|nr:SH3 domain-containing protein [Anaerolineae bacterium]
MLPGIILAQEQTITYGQTINDDLSSGEQDVWVFVGQRYDMVRLDVITSESLEVRVEVFSPSGDLAGFAETRSIRGTEFMDISPGEAGPHRIVVTAISGSGSYTLSLWELQFYPPPEPTAELLDANALQMLYSPLIPLEFDAPASGDTTDILIQNWIFTAEAGDEIMITVESNAIDPNVQFVNGAVQADQPSSSADAARETVILTQFIEVSGPYVIRVSDNYANDVGIYTITIEHSAIGVQPTATPTPSAPEAENFSLGATDMWQDISFGYPEGWFVTADEDLGTLAISNLKEISEATMLDEGGYVFTIFDPNAVEEILGDSVTDTTQLIDLRLNFYEGSMDGAMAAEPTFLDVGDGAALIFDYTTPDFKGIEFAVELNGQIYWIVGYTTVEQFANFEPLIYLMAQSLTTGEASQTPICDPDNQFIPSERLDNPAFEDMLIFPLDGTIPPGTQIQASLVDNEDFADFLNLAIFIEWDDGSIEYEEVTFSKVPLSHTFEDEYAPLGYFFWIWDDTLDSAILDIQCVDEFGGALIATDIPVEAATTLPPPPPTTELSVPVEATSTLPASASTTETIQCPDAPVSRMIIGQAGRVTVTPGGTNRATRIRSTASTGSAELGRIPPGDEFIVLDGPVCGEGYAWWQLDYNGIVRWTAEGLPGDYWLEPVSDSTNLPSVAASDCFVQPSGEVNMRTGPGTNFDRAGQLLAGDIQPVVAQSINNSGFIWYQLANDYWVREDVVELQGDCQTIPTTP